MKVLTEIDSNNRKKGRREKQLRRNKAKQNKIRIRILTYKKGKGKVKCGSVLGLGDWTLVVHCQNIIYKRIQAVGKEHKFIHWQPKSGIMERSLLLKDAAVRIFATLNEPQGPTKLIFLAKYMELEKWFS